MGGWGGGSGSRVEDQGSLLLLALLELLSSRISQMLFLHQLGG